MVVFMRKHFKWISLIVGIAIVAQAFAFDWKVGAGGADGTTATAGSSGDAAIAADISNMTGAKAEEVLKLKQSGLSWNEVLDRLRNTGGGNAADRESRGERLAGAGIEETVSNLTREGYSEDHILDAKMLADRLQFQLEDVSGGASAAVQLPTPSPGAEEGKKDAKKETIRKLAERFDLSMAVYGMVKLEKELGSLEAALDEYLLALQLDIRFELFFEDQEAYRKEKAEKSAGLAPDEIVTAAVVETAMLEEVQQRHDRESANAVVEPQTDPAAVTAAAGSVSSVNPLPEVHVPEVKNVKPENPAAQVMKEIESINPNRP